LFVWFGLWYGICLVSGWAMLCKTATWARHFFDLCCRARDLRWGGATYLAATPMEWGAARPQPGMNGCSIGAWLAQRRRKEDVDAFKRNYFVNNWRQLETSGRQYQKLSRVESLDINFLLKATLYLATILHPQAAFAFHSRRVWNKARDSNVQH
jgi:hypothetical protein